MMQFPPAGRAACLVAPLLWVSLAWAEPIPVHEGASADLTRLLGAYAACTDTHACEAIRKSVGELVWSRSRAREVIIPQLLDPSEIRCEITETDLSGKGGDFAILVSIEGFGCLAIAIRTARDEYELLSLIEVGDVDPLRISDVNGDGRQEILLSGFGRGSGYYSHWVDVYMFIGRDLVSVWNGNYEESVSSEPTKATIERTSVTFQNPEGCAPAQILQVGERVVEDLESGAVLLRDKIQRVFRWSTTELRYVEVVIPD